MAIEKIGTEDHLYLALRNEARKWVEANYDGKLNAKKLLNHFKKSLEKALTNIMPCISDMF